MKILFSSYLFAPSVGGIESVSKILAEKFAAAGNDVHVITQSVGDERTEGKYRITRRPSPSELMRLVRWSDLLFQNNISLRSLIPALLRRKKVLVVHQTWLQSADGGVGWNNRIKRQLLSSVINVSISKAVASRLDVPSCIIGNPYDDATFRLIPGITRDRTFVFVGRLVSDKGVDILLRGLKGLQEEGFRTDLTIIGSGPEEQALRGLANELSLDRQVIFAGRKSGAALAEALNRHHILVVPSRWAEPFGVVALEGIACGCVIVGSQDGGLKEAIGPCGLTFENGNSSALSGCLKDLLTHPQLAAKLREQAPEHLAKFRSATVAAAHLKMMQGLVA